MKSTLILLSIPFAFASPMLGTSSGSTGSLLDSTISFLKKEIAYIKQVHQYHNLEFEHTYKRDLYADAVTLESIVVESYRPRANLYEDTVAFGSQIMDMAREDAKNVTENKITERYMVRSYDEPYTAVCAVRALENLSNRLKLARYGVKVIVDRLHDYKDRIPYELITEIHGIFKPIYFYWKQSREYTDILFKSSMESACKEQDRDHNLMYSLTKQLKPIVKKMAVVRDRFEEYKGYEEFSSEPLFPL